MMLEPGKEQREKRDSEVVLRLSNDTTTVANIYMVIDVAVLMGSKHTGIFRGGKKLVPQHPNHRLCCTSTGCGKKSNTCTMSVVIPSRVLLPRSLRGLVLADLPRT